MAPEDDAPETETGTGQSEFPKPFPADEAVGEVIPPPPESAELKECHELLREALNLPRLSDDELRVFVDDFVSNRIFTSAHLHDSEVNMIPMVFMPVALGCFSTLQPDSLGQIGCLYEEYAKAGPSSVNGRPIFFSFKMLHIEDWKRAQAAIVKEQDRRKIIEL